MAIFTFYYNQGGENRMPFAKAVAEIIGVKPKYSGTPKCAYIMDFATVTREGNIEVDDQTDNAKLVNLVQKLMERGYMTEQSGNDWDDEDGPADTGAAAVDAGTAAVDADAADAVAADAVAADTVPSSLPPWMPPPWIPPPRQTCPLPLSALRSRFPAKSSLPPASKT